MEELTNLANLYASDKGTIAPVTGHHGPRLGFTEVYAGYFGAVRNDRIHLLEIGIGSGPSLRVWYDYFPNARISAIDVVGHKECDNDRVRTYVADQSSDADLLRVVRECGGDFDVVIDDGSHVCEHQQRSLALLFRYLRPGGQYWVEDLHTSDRSVWRAGVILYGYDMGANVGRQNSVEVFEEFERTRRFDSAFVGGADGEYLEASVAECRVFDLGVTPYGRNKLAYFRKSR